MGGHHRRHNGPLSAKMPITWSTADGPLQRQLPCAHLELMSSTLRRQASAHLLRQAEAWNMLAFALVAYEPDFFMQVFYQGQLVTSIQLLQGLEGSISETQPFLLKAWAKERDKTGHKRANAAAE